MVASSSADIDRRAKSRVEPRLKIVSPSPALVSSSSGIKVVDSEELSSCLGENCAWLTAATSSTDKHDARRNRTKSSYTTSWPDSGIDSDSILVSNGDFDSA